MQAPRIRFKFALPLVGCKLAQNLCRHHAIPEAAASWSGAVFGAVVVSDCVRFCHPGMLLFSVKELTDFWCCRTNFLIDLLIHSLMNINISALWIRSSSELGGSNGSSSHLAHKGFRILPLVLSTGRSPSQSQRPSTSPDTQAQAQAQAQGPSPDAQPSLSPSTKHQAQSQAQAEAQAQAQAQAEAQAASKAQA